MGAEIPQLQPNQPTTKPKIAAPLLIAGALNACYQAEQIQLFSYPILPENLARPEKDRLLRPPYNPVFK